tara:strand:+ start:7663 stop:8355 length:693 start_codon:yes stop_codon:yes gene_type:complete
VQDLLFAKSLDSKFKKDEDNLRIWLFPLAAPLKQITAQEKKWANELEAKRKIEFTSSRAYARLAISNIYNVDPLDVPLFAPPGKAPKLKKGWGFISLSHCQNGVLIGWSPYPIGVDIEISKRMINGNNLKERILSVKEKENFKNIDIKKVNEHILSKWVAKEAAIKWQRGNLFKDLNQWESSPHSDFYFHQSISKKVYVKLISLRIWLIAIAYDNEKHPHDPIICLDKVS